MRTNTKTTATKTTFLILGLFFALFMTAQTSYAQKVDVKGVVKGKTDTEPELLLGVNIYLKDKSLATSTNRKGEFSFTRALNVGDILVFSYLGYLKKEIKITTQSTNLNILLEEDDNEMLGAISTNKRFSSKRKDKN